MRATDYSTALQQLLSDGHEPSALLSRLRAVLQKRGHTKLLRAILTDLLRTTERSAQADAPRLVLARESDRAQRAALIKEDLATLGLPDAPDPEIDETLAGGHVLEHRFRRIDRSYKQALLDLFTNATKHTTQP